LGGGGEGGRDDAIIPQFSAFFGAELIRKGWNMLLTDEKTI
jgi:hypothetical protein